MNRDSSFYECQNTFFFYRYPAEDICKKQLLIKEALDAVTAVNSISSKCISLPRHCTLHCMKYYDAEFRLIIGVKYHV